MQLTYDLLQDQVDREFKTHGSKRIDVVLRWGFTPRQHIASNLKELKTMSDRENHIYVLSETNTSIQNDPVYQLLDSALSSLENVFDDQFPWQFYARERFTNRSMTQGEYEALEQGDISLSILNTSV